MVLPINGINYILKVTGEPIRIRYYNQSVNGVYDDDSTYTQSGTDYYTSGTFLEVGGTKGSEDAINLQEGRLKYGDIKAVISGTVPTTSGILVFTLSKSGTDTVYRQITLGTHAPAYYGNPAYKLVYLREVVGGSLY